MLAATAAGGVVTAATMTTASAATPVKSDIAFGNPNDPPQGAINAKNPRSVTDPGPQNPAIRDQFPGAFSPPPTDVGNMPLSWAIRTHDHAGFEPIARCYAKPVSRFRYRHESLCGRDAVSNWREFS